MEERIEKLIREEHELHPVAELIDFYKLFFQASCGPGHLVENRDRASRFLHEELQETLDNHEPLVQDISLGENDYCRVDLKVIQNGLITEKEFFFAFIKSVPNKIEPAEFPELWPTIESKIKELNIFGPAFIMERKILSAVLGTRKVNHPRHSERFRREYNPHYRLIRKQFIKLSDIKPDYNKR
jgi:hypothetical protein